MAWKIYVKVNGGTVLAPGIYKTLEDAKLFYRRNKDLFKQSDGSTGKPIYVEQGKGRGK